jgi:L-alanine-DL-glutamate epimerase-like enolase superfamily enzyme
VKLSLERRKLHLRHPFLIARSMDDTSTEREMLFVRIEHKGKVGWGEAAPTSYYHQTLDSSEAALKAMGEMLGNDPFALDRILDPIYARFADQSAAIAALDGALHDLIGKLLDMPVWKLLGLDAEREPLTSFTIGIDKPEVMAAKVREASEYPILKIKIGTPDDDAVLTAVRREAPNKTLYVDANCGWTSANVLERMKSTWRYKIECIEQPTPPDDLKGLAAVRAAGLGPILADESCIGVDDVLRCVGVFDGINIKLSKCGGMRRALQMIHTARSAGLRIMIGCMLETSVGLAAAAHLGPLVDYLDLDGHLLLADDPFDGLGGAAGQLTLTDRPGLGLVERKS